MIYRSLVCFDRMETGHGTVVGYVTKDNSKFIIIIEICKASILRLKALNKHSITHVMYIEMEMLSAISKNIHI